MCTAIFPSPAIGSGRKIFSPNLPNNLLRAHEALSQIESQKNRSKVGTNLGVFQMYLSEH
jgi:hypothetical protein